MTATSNSPSARCRARCRCRACAIVIDCANGAGYKVAPAALWELGAEVITINNEPNGFNINKECGSTHPMGLSKKVHEVRADIGIALDGDADRVVIVDENGTLVDGDQIMALIAESWHQAGRLAGGGVVATVMSNLGLERFLGGIGLQLHRTKVGDRYVVEHMRAHGLNVGGEQSGHIVLSDFSTTGDGLVSALQVLACMKRSNKPVSEICRKFEPVPQVLKNVRFSGGKPLESAPVKAAIEDAAQPARRRRPAGHPPVRHRAADPRHGGSRRSASWSKPSSTTSSALFPRRAPRPDADRSSGKATECPPCQGGHFFGSSPRNQRRESGFVVKQQG